MYFNEKKQELAPFVNLRSDVGFKAVFADRNNKDILIGVLNMILPSEARIDDITEYSDREQRRDVPYGKKTVLDLVCRDKSGRTFVVEMQAAEEDNFFERCVYYASGLYHLELSDGERYKGLRPVYVVSFLNYHLKHDDESLWDTDHFISYWQFTERRTGMVANQTISVIFVEMTLFTKTLEECVTEYEWDILAQREFAERKGFEKGYADGEAKGIADGTAKGMAEGMAKGKAEGMIEGRLEVAKALLASGMPIEQIELYTKLSKEQIETIQ